jgi:hypothetical protein
MRKIEWRASVPDCSFSSLLATCSGVKGEVAICSTCGLFRAPAWLRMLNSCCQNRITAAPQDLHPPRQGAGLFLPPPSTDLFGSGNITRRSQRPTRTSTQTGGLSGGAPRRLHLRNRVPSIQNMKTTCLDTPTSSGSL